MDRKNRPADRLDYRVPHSLSFMVLPALVRAPWLIGSFFETDESREAERRRKFRR
jgi:hypothetical protein